MEIDWNQINKKNFTDFKAVIPLDWMMGGAKVLPKIIKVDRAIVR